MRFICGHFVGAARGRSWVALVLGLVVLSSGGAALGSASTDYNTVADGFETGSVVAWTPSGNGTATVQPAAHSGVYGMRYFGAP